MNKRISVFRKEHFCAAHRLNNPSWTEEKNNAVFGKCNNPNYHGHNYELNVKVTGEPAADTGFVIDLKYLSDLIKEMVIEKLDHKNLNLDVPFLQGKIVSCENLVKSFWEILAPLILDASNQRARLHKLKLYETPTSFAAYRGDE